MSRSIYVKVFLRSDFYSQNVSAFLFSVIGEGCRRNIAVSIPEEKYLPCPKEGCFLTLEDSFNFKLTKPLIGDNENAEVIEYRNEALFDRLQNLQELLLFVLNQDVVEKIEVYFTMNYMIDDLDVISAKIKDLPSVWQKIVRNDSDYHYKFCFEKAE